VNEHVAPPGAEPLPGSAGALDMAMDAERHDLAPDSPAREVLRKHARLLDEQVALARNERFRNRIKAARDAALAALAVGVIVGAAWFVWDASRADGAVIEPFAVAPALAQQGLTGEVVANRLLARIALMQAATPSSRPSRSSRGDGDEIAVEIPQAGITFSEISRLLRRRFGNETVVTGELGVDEGGAPVLTVLVDGVPAPLPAPPTANAPQEPTVAMLLDRGAEAVFGRADPLRYSTWLYNVAGRPEEGVRLARSNSLRGPAKDRAWATSGLSVRLRRLGRFREAVLLANEAARLDPLLRNAQGNAAFPSALMGHDEAAFRYYRRALQLPVDRTRGAERNEMVFRWYVQTQTGDFAGLLATAERASELSEDDAQADGAVGFRAEALARLHDVSASDRASAARARPMIEGSTAWKTQLLWRAAALEDWAAMERGLGLPTAVAAATSPQPDAWSSVLAAALDRTLFQPWRARAVAAQGRFEEAARIAAATPADCYQCVRARARVAALAGDRAAADRWFEEAVRQAPSPPFAYSEWGEAKLARGDFDGAIRLFREARERGPRWADPLKFEGDALARRGEHRAALAKYEAAAERAPRWGGLHLAWARALEALGREKQARAKYAQAARLDLSAADRAAVRRLLARTPAPAR
jgi:tetratricopeptide (TPR) repeat protein